MKYNLTVSKIIIILFSIWIINACATPLTVEESKVEIEEQLKGADSYNRIRIYYRDPNIDPINIRLKSYTETEIIGNKEIYDSNGDPIVRGFIHIKRNELYSISNLSKPRYGCRFC